MCYPKEQVNPHWLRTPRSPGPGLQILVLSLRGNRVTDSKFREQIDVRRSTSRTPGSRTHLQSRANRPFRASHLILHWIFRFLICTMWIVLLPNHRPIGGLSEDGEHVAQCLAQSSSPMHSSSAYCLPGPPLTTRSTVLSQTYYPWEEVDAKNKNKQKYTLSLPV